MFTGGCNNATTPSLGLSKGKQGEIITLRLAKSEAQIQVMDSFLKIASDSSSGTITVKVRIVNSGKVPFSWIYSEKIADKEGRIYSGLAMSFSQGIELNPGTFAEYEMIFSLIQFSESFYFCGYDTEKQEISQFKIELTPKLQ